MMRSAFHFGAIVTIGAMLLASGIVVLALAPHLLAPAGNPCTCTAVAHPSAWLWLALLGAGAVVARFTFVIIQTARRTCRFLRRTLAGARITPARRLGLTTPWPIDLLPDSTAIFCYGFFHPRLAIGERLFSLLDAEQLAAVVAHESAHARRRDPLRLFLVTIVSDALGRWLGGPALRRAFTVHVECDADQAAVVRCGRTPLANAFLRMLDAVGPRQPVAVPLLSVTETRILQLLGEDYRPRIRFAIIAAIAIGFMGVVGLQAVARTVEGPAPAMATGAMCRRPPVCAAPTQEVIRCMTVDRSTVCIRRAVVEPLSRLR